MITVLSAWRVDFRETTLLNCLCFDAMLSKVEYVVYISSTI